MKPQRDTRYLAWIRTQPCIICPPWKRSQIEAAHVGPRGVGQKCSDRQTVPLCLRHHQTGRDAHHRLGRRFWEHHGLNRDAVIADLVTRYEEETGRKAA
jgi:hypothetical protein